MAIKKHKTVRRSTSHSKKKHATTKNHKKHAAKATGIIAWLEDVFGIKATKTKRKTAKRKKATSSRSATAHKRKNLTAKKSSSRHHAKFASASRKRSTKR